MAILSYLATALAPPAVAQVDQQRAQEYFREVQALRIWDPDKDFKRKQHYRRQRAAHLHIQQKENPSKPATEQLGVDEIREFRNSLMKR